MVQLKRIIPAGLLAISLILSAAGSTTVLAADQTSSSAKPVSVSTGASQAVLDYLKTAKTDLGLIDEIMSDKNLGLLDTSNSTNNETITQDTIGKYDTLLTGYISRIKKVLSGIDSRSVPELPDLGKLKTSETSAFQTLDSILQEYDQTLKYAGTILKVSADIDSLQNIKESDLQKIYNAYHAGIGDAIKELQAATVPSFIESFNQDFIDALKQVDDAVLYALNAVALNDPMRSSSAKYLTGVLVRHLGQISAEWTTDLGDRQKTLQNDSLTVQKKADGLKSWLDANIAKLGS